MEPYPTLHTERLVLRAFTLDDAPAVRRLAQAREVARMTLNLPHPYEKCMAEEWITGLRPAFEAGTRSAFAVTLREGGTLVGTVSLFIDERDRAGLLGFWIGLPYWGNGYATEAVAEVVRYGFGERGLLHVRANHFGSNPASGRVLRKVGMVHVGTRQSYYEKWGEAEDRIEYSLDVDDWRETVGG
jgi:ribosomal-protein-alanine N-acetyltransferase